MAQETPDIRVLVGVEGASIDGKSGKLIAKELSKIAKDISTKKAPQVAFTVNTKLTSQYITNQLNEIVKSIHISPIALNIQTNQSSIGSSFENDISRIVNEYNSAINLNNSKSNTRVSEKKALVEFEIQKATKLKEIKESTAEIELKTLLEKKSALAELEIQTFQTKKQNAADIELQKTIEKRKALNQLSDERKKDIDATKQQEKAVKDLSKALQLLGSFDEDRIFAQSDNLISKLGRTDLLPQFETLKAESSQLQEQVAKLKGELSFDDLAKEISKPNASDEIKEIANKAQIYSKAISDFQKNASATGASFNKELRNADNGKLLDNLILKVTKFEKVNDKFKSNSGLAVEFERIKNALNNLKFSGDFSKVDIDKLDRQFSEFKTNVVSLGQEGQTAFGKLRAQMDKLGVYFGASAIMMGAWRQIKNMTNNVIELDTAMTELKKVSDETDVTYSRFLDNAEVRAKKLGSTLTDTIRSTANAARMGYSLNEAESLSDTFNIYKNVGDGIKDIEQASSSVISAMKAFNITASDSMRIVDAYNEVSNNFAVQSDEIGLAVADMGAAFAGAGNSMEESIAVYTGMNEIIQDWSKSSTAMRTIAARLRNTAGELEELGVDSEGAAESVTQLQTQLLNLTKGKVNIMDGTDTFKSTTQILRELASVWNELSDKDRADVTRLVSGIRQQSTLQAVLTNWKQVEAAITTAMDSSGSAFAENEKYLDSIKGKVAQFQAQYEALSNTIINSGLIKGTIDTGTGLVGFLDSVVKNLGEIPTLATVAAGAISAFTNKGGYAPLIKVA